MRKSLAGCITIAAAVCCQPKTADDKSAQRRAATAPAGLRG